MTPQVLTSRLTKFGDYLSTWLATLPVRVSRSSARTYRSMAASNIAGKPIAAMAISEIGRADVDEWMQSLAGLAPSSRHVCLIVVRRALAQAVRDGLLPANPAVRSRRSAMTQGFVYLVRCGDFVKIGHSVHHPDNRVVGMQVGTPHQLTLVAVVPGGRDLERSLHATFEHLETRGEWFTAAPEIFAMFDKMGACLPVAVPLNAPSQAVLPW